MAQTQAIQRRIRSVRNAGQLTKALEVVAASRMRRVQTAVASASRYAELADSIMRRIAPSQEAAHHPYFKESNGNTNLYIVFNSDRGQAGAFNANVFSLAHKAFMADKAAGVKSAIIVFGRKGSSHFARLEHAEMIGAYDNIEDIPQANVFAPLLESIKDGMETGQFKSVQILYTKFVSSLVQHATQTQLLPISRQVGQPAESGAKPVIDTKVYEFEPAIENVLEQALRIYFESRLMAARIESAASENAMRMVAMGNAHRNASDLADSLVLELNSVRQAAITQEIAEITGGAQAIAA